MTLRNKLTALAAHAQQADGKTSFFVTGSNPGKGADLGGLAGADKRCQALAADPSQGGDP